MLIANSTIPTMIVVAFIKSFTYLVIYNVEYPPCSNSEAVVQPMRSNRHSRSDSEAVFLNRKLPESGEGEADVEGLKASEECARATDGPRGRTGSGYISRQSEDGLRETFELLPCREMNDRQLDLLNLHRYRAIGGGDEITDQLRGRNSGSVLHPVLRTGGNAATDNRC